MMPTISLAMIVRDEETNLAGCLVDMLAESSVESKLAMADFFQSKAGEIRSLMDYKWILARGLYV